jgi:predicted PurR-regulated permease PerM
MTNPDEGSQTRLLHRIAILLSVVVAAIGVAFFYFASSLCLAFLLAGFLAIVAEPLVGWLEESGLGRVTSATLVVLLGVVVVASGAYFGYQRVSDFVDEAPRYADKIRGAIEPISKKIQRVQENAGKVNPNPIPKKVPEVKLRESPSWISYVARGVGSVSGAIVVAGVVPFLVFFMLVRKQHIFWWLSTTFGTMTDVPKFAEHLGKMVRGFAGGNLLIGSGMAVVLVGVFLAIGLDQAVTIGIAAGFLNLIPFVGVILAGAIPLLAATLQFHSVGPFLIIAGAVTVLHLVSANILIPKFVGSRVNVGPVAATVGMLFWSWVWGGIGFLLAIPLTAFVKLVADCHPTLLPIANLLAETPRQPQPRWGRAGDALVRVLPRFRERWRSSPSEGPKE